MPTIGIGLSHDSKRLISNIQEYRGSCRIVCYSHIDTDIQSLSCDIIQSEQPGRDLVADLMAGTIDAGIRGTLPAHETLSFLKIAAGIHEIERIVLLESASKKRFFLAPVGIDEGWTVTQKISLINNGMKMVKRLGLPGRVGVLSGGRLDDVGRHPIVDTSLADALLICRVTGATFYEILIEDALPECGLIIAPDGISGNLIFRTLVFAGAGAAHGAPVVNLDKIFVDTSRVNPSYIGAIELAATLID